jgi:hypothetical protein
MRAQVKATLRAVSGEAWNYVGHAFPNHTVDVMVGVPAFPEWVQDANSNWVHRKPSVNDVFRATLRRDTRVGGGRDGETVTKVGWDTSVAAMERG